MYRIKIVPKLLQSGIKSHHSQTGFAIPGLLLLVAVTALLFWLFSAKTSQVQAEVPTQPIEFPHNIHTASIKNDGNAINCLYCHSYARRSTVAGIPTLAKCMGCHNYVATNKKRIKQLSQYWEQRKPIAWKKVHDLPDFVYFTHERHIQRFVFKQGQPVQQVCGYCHGDIKTMTVAEKRRPLTMGWCLKCHEQFQENPVKTPQPEEDWLISAADQGLVAPMPDNKTHKLNKAPSDCWDCHK
jgi:hypothetical protein